MVVKYGLRSGSKVVVYHVGDNWERGADIEATFLTLPGGRKYDYSTFMHRIRRMHDIEGTTKKVHDTNS